jgi:pimeloyl-ACP methyl ester carboxylesterase
MLLLTVLTVAALYAGVCALVFANQRRLIYPAPHGPLARPPEGVGYRVLPAAGGLPEVHLLDVPAPGGAGPTVVYLHGNGEQVLDAVTLAEGLAAQGMGLLAVEYPGYGFAPGAPGEAAIYAAAERALALLAERGVPGGDVVLLGRSLGSGVAVELARRGHGARVVLVSPFTSLGDMAARLFFWLPARLLLRDRYASLDKAPLVRQPVLVLHGERDTLVPVEMGRRLAERLPHGTFVQVPHVGHNDILVGAGDPLHRRIAAFVRGEAPPPGR